MAKSLWPIQGIYCGRNDRNQGSDYAVLIGALAIDDFENAIVQPRANEVDGAICDLEPAPIQIEPKSLTY